MKKLVLYFALVILFCSCAPAPAPTTEKTDRDMIATKIVGEITAEAEKIEPIQTISPTQTLPAPTGTPAPEPITLTGSGDSVVDFENPFDVAIAHIIGNKEGRYFGVRNYGADGNSIDLLVNTTDPYDRIKPLDFRSGEHTVRFEVTSSGEWSIEILPLSAARTVSVPGIIEGYGDDVILLTGEAPDLAKISGNNESKYFGVKSYGQYFDLLVNTTDPYEGTVILKSGTLVLEVTASGSWSIEIT